MIDITKAGVAITALRQSHGLTQQQLASILTVTRQAVSKWEKGQTLPDIQTLMEMARLFRVSMEQILLNDLPDESKGELTW